MSAVATAIVVAGVAGAAISANASQNAADTQAAAAGNATQTQWNMYNQTRTDQAPWRTAGANALGALQNWYGLGGASATSPNGGAGVGTPSSAAGFGPGAAGGRGGTFGGGQLLAGPGGVTPNTGTPGAPSAQTQMQTIENTPGYQFQFGQGEQALQRNLASQGLLNSGAAGKALTQYGQGIASNYAQQYVGGLQSLAGLGIQSGGITANAGMNAANQIGSNQIYAGNAGAYGQIGQANAINNGLGSLANAYGRYNAQQPNSDPYSLDPGTTSTSGSYGIPGSSYTYQGYGP